MQIPNALAVKVKQKPEGYCSVLDIRVSLMTPASDSRIRGRPILLSKSRTELASENLQIIPRDNLAVVGLTDFF
jgi:hypothetical protein